MNNKMKWLLALIAVVGITFGVAPVAPTLAQGSEWKVVSQEKLPFSGGFAYLSPDGKHIAHILGAKFCVFTPQGEQETCLATGKPDNPNSIDRYAVKWSPDSQRIALTDNFYQYFRDPDIWVLDIASGSVKNLTDDKVDKFNIDTKKGDENGALDVAPSWSPDSKLLYFLRCEQPCTTMRSTTFLYSIDVASGKLEKRAALDGSVGVIYGMALSPDGKQIAYLVNNNDLKQTTNGLYIMDSKGKNVKQVLQAQRLLAVEFSADGKYLLGYSPYAEGAYATTAPKEIFHRVVSLETGAEISIDPDRLAMWPGWSAAGASIAYLYRDPKLDRAVSGLYIVDKPGSKAQLVQPALPAASVAYTRGIQWATNNTLLLHMEGKFTLLTLSK